MTSRAPFYEGVEGRLNFPGPKSVVSLSCSFSVHSGWIFFFFFLVTSVLLAVYPGDNLLFPAQNQARE